MHAYIRQTNTQKKIEKSCPLDRFDRILYMSWIYLSLACDWARGWACMYCKNLFSNSFYGSLADMKLLLILDLLRVTKGYVWCIVATWLHRSTPTLVRQCRRAICHSYHPTRLPLKMGHQYMHSFLGDSIFVIKKLSLLWWPLHHNFSPMLSYTRHQSCSMFVCTNYSNTPFCTSVICWIIVVKKQWEGSFKNLMQ